MSWRRTAAASGCAVALLVGQGAVRAQLNESLPEDLERVGVTQKLDERLPLQLEFTDDRGATVKLERYFDGQRPVLLVLAYYECPMLCTLVLDGLVQALQETDWTPGGPFDVVTVSIDPAESTALARQKKQNYVAALGRPQAAAGWHFLTGDARSVAELADSVGFRYEYLTERGEYAHPAVLVVLTPEGRISRYLFGVQHDPTTLRLSLVEAGRGEIGSLADRFLLYCYRYDATEGRYAPAALKLMRLGGLVMLVALGALLLRFWLREARQKRLA